MTRGVLRRLIDIPPLAGWTGFDHEDSQFFSFERQVLSGAFNTCRALLEAHLQDLKNKGAPVRETIFDINDSLTINAQACAIGQRDVIVVNGGLGIALLSLYMKAMCCNDLFSWIGAPTEADRSIDLEGLPDSFASEILAVFKKIGGEPTQFVQDVRLGLSPDVAADITVRRLMRQSEYAVDPLGLIPADQERRNFAYKLWYLSMSFVSYHELAHILRGHVEYLAEKSQQWIYLEIGRTGEAEVARHQEVQADLYAAIGTLLPIMTVGVHSEADLGGRIYAWGFSIAALFGVLRILEGVNIPEADRTHPAPTHRLAVAMTSASVRLDHVGISRERIVETAAVGFSDADSFLSKIFGHRYRSIDPTEVTPHQLEPLKNAWHGRYTHHDKWHRFDRLDAYIDRALFGGFF